MQPMPLMDGVKSGVLPNGLHYYVLHNELPKDRANFYIAQKVGSTLEEPSQLGLAHFLEHMAFNGTKNFPGKNLLNYLQNKGIRFGADINAYTGFDETVYNIDNVPTNDKALMDSVLLALRDWSCAIALEEDEINSERGVINEEWRQRNDVGTRMFTTILPQIYSEYQYQQMPIGKMDVVMNFKPEVLRAYYEKWYRPDQQGIVIVGDFDAAEMEKKVIEMFSSIPMPENAAERTYAAVSDNVDPIYATFQDKEMQYSLVRVSFKSDELPFEMRNTFGAYVEDSFLKNMVQALINNRLDEARSKADCPYVQAGVNMDSFYVSSNKDDFQIVVVAQGDPTAALTYAMEIVARACKTGFTESEVERVRDNIKASYEKMYNERDKIYNTDLGKDIIRHFIDNQPMPGVEVEYQLSQMILPQIPTEAYNQLASQLLTPNNQVIVLTGPADINLPSKEAAIEIVNNAINKEYQAYVDEVITEPLIAKYRKAGKIVSKKKNDVVGTTEYTLSNGAKVVVKATDFAADEITMQAFKEGGKRSYTDKQAVDVLSMEDVYNLAKLGKFDINKLKKYLAGKKVGLEYGVGNMTNYLEGSTTVKDFETLMELIYASFTALNPDQELFNTQMKQAKSMLLNVEKNPKFIYGEHLIEARYGNNPMMKQTTAAMIDKVNYKKTLKLVKQSLSNAADFTFIFVGNVDEKTLEPMLEKYIASLPSKGKASKVKTLNTMSIRKGQIDDQFDQPMQSPAVTVFDQYTNTGLAYNVDNLMKFEMLSDILDIVYTATLREELGGTYGAATRADINPLSGQWSIIYQFQTADEKRPVMLARAHSELQNLLENGAKEADFNKVREAALKQLDIEERTNKYWRDNLLSFYRGYNLISGHRAALQNMTLADLNAFMKSLNIDQNRIQVVMNGVAE